MIEKEIEENSFLEAMKICKRTVSILDKDCKVYSRLWCMYEVYKSVVDDKGEFEFDVYTKIHGRNAVGITHSYLPNESEMKGTAVKDDPKKLRESQFPLDRILKSTEVDIKEAEATEEADKKFILNTITGRGKDDEVLDNHTNYDKLNNALRGIFITPVLDRIIKYGDVNTITRWLAILKESNARILNLNLVNCSRFNDNLLQKLVDSLPSSSLTELRLCWRGSAVTVNGIKVLIDRLKDCSQLVSLNLSENNIDDDVAKKIAEILSSLMKLESLYLSNNNIGDIGATTIADGLKANHMLKTLDLRKNNNIGLVGANYLEDVLKINHTLIKLDLYGNQLGDDGVTTLANALKDNDKLQDLNLSENNVGDDGAVAIADALKANYTLKKLHLINNNISDVGATKIAIALESKHSSLQILNLSGNKITGIEVFGLENNIENRISRVNILL